MYEVDHAHYNLTKNDRTLAYNLKNITFGKNAHHV